MRVIVPVTIDDSTFVSSSIAEADAPAWVSTTIYAADAEVMVAHKVYRSLSANNVGNDPTDSGSIRWVEVRPTNRWAMFDASASTSSEASGSITFSITVPAFNDIVFSEIVASSVSITAPSGSRTVSVPAPVSPATTSTLWIDDMASAGGTLSVTISGSGTVKLGAFSAGTITILGQPERGAGFRIIDYSRRSVDEFGAVTLVRRGYSKQISARAMIPAADINRVAGIMTALRSAAAVWILVQGKTSMMALGYYRDWSCTKESKANGRLEVTIESLVLDAVSGVDTGTGGGGGGVSDIPIDLIDPSLTVTGTTGGASAEAGFTVMADGRTRKWGKVNGAETTSSYIAGTWATSGAIAPEIAALYEVQFGSGAWMSLSSDRSISQVATTGQDLVLSSSAKIRRAATGVVLATTWINLRAIVPASSPPPPPPPPPPDPNTSLGLASSYSLAAEFEASGEAVIGFRAQPNGTWEILRQASGGTITASTGTPDSGDWHPSPATGVGSSYQVRFTVNSGSGSPAVTNQAPSWTTINASRAFLVGGSGARNVTIEIRAIGATAVATSTTTFTATTTITGGGGG